MEVTVINFTDGERSKFIKFLANKHVNTIKRKEVTEKELSIIRNCLDKAPIGDNKAMRDGLNERIKAYEQSCKNSDSIVSKLDEFITGVENRKETSISTHIYECITDLYRHEKSNVKHGSDIHMYKYYPRMKRAKEKSLYVFVDKIKLITEAQNVRFA